MIEAQNLVKRFGHRLALRGLSLSVEPGDVVGLIGPNGAGKTTSIRILATLLAPDAGSARVAGFDVREDAARVRALVGHMPERFGLYDELTVAQYLDVFARVYGLRGRARRAHVEAVLDLVDLEGKREDRCEGLSKGVRQRVYLARTLLHDPAVLLLDEPASGLDPQARIDLRELLRALREQGKTILISSHILSELERVCTRAVVIEGGRLRFHGSLDDAAARFGQGVRVRLRLLDPSQVERALGVLEQDPHAGPPVQEEACLRFAYGAAREEIPGLLRRLVAADLDVLGFDIEPPDLEALFLDVTRGEIT